MHTDTISTRKLTLERDELSHGARLHWFHWSILILSGILTIAAWYFSKTQLEEKTSIQFERQATQAVELVSERMQKYGDALWSGVAAIQASDDHMSHSEWRTFASSLHIEAKYPGISGIGVVDYANESTLESHLASQRQLRPDYRVHPQHAEKDYFPIVYIEPEAPNAKAVGLDMAHETNRYTAAKKARDTGTAQITGPIVLVQDAGKTPGFLFYAPYYADGVYSSAAERQENFLGMVYAPFVVKNLMAGTLEKNKRSISIRMTDGADILYDEHTVEEADFDPIPLFAKTVSVDAYGRTWDFEIWSSKSFRAAAESTQPTFILIGGIAIDSLLLTLFLMLSRANRRTLSFADRMTAELRETASELRKSNSELESFAYVTSHDLKTPLRGIADLTTYLEEDLAEYMSRPAANGDVRNNIDRLYQQTDRMDNLIKAILDYSGVGIREESTEVLSVASVLTSIREAMKIRDEQLILDGLFPVLTTYRTRFEQVMNNLVGNAFKYHHDADNALVTVSCQENGGFYEFSVADNGPGIDPKFHSRIFEVFQTLQSKDEIESTGVGLSIVKKSVEGLGGSITVSSELGSGTTFTFSWPKVISKQVQDKKAVS